MINYQLKELVMAIKNDPDMITNWMEDQKKNDYLIQHIEDYKKYKNGYQPQRSKSTDQIQKFPRIMQNKEAKFQRQLQKVDEQNSTIIQRTLRSISKPASLENKLQERYSKIHISHFNERFRIGQLLKNRKTGKQKEQILRQDQIKYLQERLGNLDNMLEERKIPETKMEFKEKYNLDNSIFNQEKYQQKKYEKMDINLRMDGQTMQQYIQFRNQLMEKIKKVDK